jgi:hypothetical protein
MLHPGIAPAIPDEAEAACFARTEILTLHHLPAASRIFSVTLSAGPARLTASTGLAIGQGTAVSRQPERSCQSGRSLHRLAVVESIQQGFQRRVEFSIPVTVLICEIWVVTAALSSGLSGS